jgi:lysyl-tRNA synthetase, class II
LRRWQADDIAAVARDRGARPEAEYAELAGAARGLAALWSSEEALAKLSATRFGESDAEAGRPSGLTAPRADSANSQPFPGYPSGGALRLQTVVILTESGSSAAPALGWELEHELGAARVIVERHGEDSISPFILRTDKALAFAAGGVLAYRLIGRTAVISGDPVAPAGGAPDVLASFIQTTRERGWKVVLYGASAHHLSGYQSLGFRALCVGEEAVVDPDRFTLEGRSVRKLRQSVHRVARHDWVIKSCEGREIDAALESEIDALEATWRRAQPRLLGFAMGMGESDPGVQAGDLYLLARAPSGELRAVMRFISHCGKLSLDTMRRIGETPNGLNEALVCRALELARERGVAEVSLNYAGLAHLVRNGPPGGVIRRNTTRLAIALLGRRFQMERLVRFNQKFAPEWRPRYLVYESRRGLPRSVFRVLQAEGYFSQPSDRRSAEARQWRRALASVQEPQPRVDGRYGR